jgi:hypothetical protein
VCPDLESLLALPALWFVTYLIFISVAPNLQFFIDDIEDDWGYEDDPFDYVHARSLAGAILNWPRLIQQAYKYHFSALSF